MSSTLAGRVYARDGNDCKPVNCTTQCIPACSASEKCILVVMNECGQCPMSQCVSLSALGISAAAADNANRDQDRQSRRVGLIAGLTTGLGVAAIIIVTLAGLVIYRRRKRRSEKEQQQQQTKDTDSYSPSSPLPPPPAAVVTPTVNAGSEAVSMNHLLPVTPTSWSQDHPPSVFMGTSALQIPRLETSTQPPTPATDTVIRRSLNILPMSRIHNDDSISRSANSYATPCLTRSSSVKVGKYDNLDSRRTNADDLIDPDDGVQLRRAVSVKKAGLTRSASVRSAITPRITQEGTEQQNAVSRQLLCAKPTMVRISTVMSNEGGVTRKRSVRTVISDTSDVHEEAPEGRVSNEDPSAPDSTASSSEITRLPQLTSRVLPFSAKRIRQESWTSQASVPDSTHSTVGDGEITIIWDASTSNRAR